MAVNGSVMSWNVKVLLLLETDLGSRCLLSFSMMISTQWGGNNTAAASF